MARKPVHLPNKKAGGKAPPVPIKPPSTKSGRNARMAKMAAADVAASQPLEEAAGLFMAAAASAPTRRAKRETAETMAAKQKDISVSEFFAKNRHLLGFDNPRKALLTTVKEAVDNSLDACEEAGIVPEIWVVIEATGNNRFKVSVQDNGPGIVKKQIPLI